VILLGISYGVTHTPPNQTALQCSLVWWSVGDAIGNPQYNLDFYVATEALLCIESNLFFELYISIEI
jgi:hypothetical protein